MLAAQTQGYKTMRVLISPEGEKTIMHAIATNKCPDGVDYVPVLKLFGVQVRVYESVPRGHVWYLLKGGKP